MLYPQPYLEEVPFLTVIPKPSVRGAISVAFHKPTSSDFVLKDPTRPWLAVGHLTPLLSAQVKLMVLELHEKYRKSILKSSPDDVDTLVRKTDRLMDYDVAIQRLLQRLSLPSPPDYCFMTLSLLQRSCLEFTALFKWVTTYRARCNSRTTKWDTLDVVGAFTDDLDVADGLFHAGIPVWVVHPLKDLFKLRIDNVVEPLPLASHKLPIGDSLFLDIQRANPPHRPIFTGKATDLARYKAMAVFLKSLISTGLLSPPINCDASTGPVRSERPSKKSSFRARPSHSYHRFTSSCTDKSSCSCETINLLHESSNRFSSATFQRRNKYVDVESPLVPPPIPSWRAALDTLSFNDQDHHQEGVNAGYALPDPGLFVSPVSDDTKALYFATWLKIRDIMIHRLLSPFEPLSNKSWRTILAIEKATPKTETREGRFRQQATQVIQDAAKAIGIDFSVTFLADCVPSWKGVEYNARDFLNVQPSREILWELYETNFRLEFSSLDAVLHKSSMSLQERDIIIDGHCWPGASRIPDLSLGKTGLNDRHTFKRKDFLQGIHLIMSEWSGPRPSCLQQRFPNVEDNEEGCECLERIEKELAVFYVTSFHRIFGRAAIVPHFLE